MNTTYISRYWVSLGRSVNESKDGGIVGVWRHFNEDANVNGIGSGIPMS